MQKDYTLVGLFGMYDSADGSWQLRAGVRNLTDEVYKTDAQESSSVGNIQTAVYGWPRNYYVSARYNFFGFCPDFSTGTETARTAGRLTFNGRVLAIFSNAAGSPGKA